MDTRTVYRSEASVIRACFAQARRWPGVWCGYVACPGGYSLTYLEDPLPEPGEDEPGEDDNEG